MARGLGHDKRSPSGVNASCSGDSSSDEVDGDGLLDNTVNTEFNRNRKVRSTVLVRRFFKNNQKVFRCNTSFLLVLILNLYLEFNVFK